MNAGRTWAIALKVFRGLRRDKRSLALILVGPVLSILAFGFVFGTDLANVRVVVVDDAHSEASQAFVDALDRDLLDVETESTLRKATERVEDGDAWAAIHIPTDYGAGGVVGLTLDGSNSQVVEAIVREIQRVLALQAPADASAPPVAQETVYAEGAKFIDFFVPGIMSFSVFVFTTLLTVLAFVGERTGGTLARLQAGPVRDSEIVMGNALAFGVVATVQVSILFVAAVLLFDIRVEGSFLLGIGIVVLLGITSQALGILLSAAARRESQAVQFMPLLVVPTLVLAGIFLPVASLPGWLRPLSYLVPPTWSTEGLRSVLLRGWGLDRVWPDLAALAGFAVVFLGLAVVLLGRQRR